MFKNLITILKYVDETYQLIKNFFIQNQNVLVRIGFLSVIIQLCFWLTKIFDSLISYFFSFLQLLFQIISFLFVKTINFFKIIFRIKPKYFFFEEGNTKTIFTADINGKLTVIRKEITPTIIIHQLPELN